MSLVDKINSVNEFGITQLNAHGIDIIGEPGITGVKPVTTYDIMSAISMISSGGGGGIEYTSITCNEDNTITLVDVEGTTHTMSYTCDDGGKVSSITFDGATVSLQYDGDVLTKLDDIELDFKNIPVAPAVPDTPNAPSVSTPMTTATSIDVMHAINVSTTTTVEYNNTQITIDTTLESEE